MNADDFSLITDPLPEAMLLLSADGRVLAVNTAAAALAGVPAAALRGRRLDELLDAPPGTLEAIVRRWARTREPTPAGVHLLGKSGRVECRCDGALLRPAADGVPALLLVRCQPRDMERAASRFVALNDKIAALNREIAERRRAEAALQAQRESLRVTLSSIGDGVIATDDGGRVTFMSRVAETLTGWDLEQAVGRPLEDVFTVTDEETGRPVENAVRRVLESAATVALTNHTVLVARDGRRRPIDDSGAPIRDADGTVRGVVLVFRDVSERRRVEAERRESEARFRMLADTAPVMVWMVDQDKRCTFFNRGWLEFTGHRLEEELDRGWITAMHPDDVPRCTELYARAFDAREPFDVECRVRRADGEYRWIVNRGVPRYDAGGVFAGYIGACIDIDDRKRSQDERADLLRREQAARTAAEAASRMKDDFLATLSHELRTPLNAIYGWARMLRAGLLDAAGAERAVEVIERNTHVQIQLMNDLLDVSRIILGRLRLHPRPVDLGAVVAAAVDVIGPTAAAKGVGIVVAADPAAGPVSGDPDRLQQVVWNLLSNAVKFTPAGGRVAVRVERLDRDAAITVQDDGAGIAADVLPHIFERFRQADSSTTRQHGGLGLGLAIVKHLTELHGGSVEAASEGRGRGARFTVRLPLAAAHTAPALAGATRVRDRALPSLAGVRALVVEDELDSRELVAALLEQCGAQVRTVVSSAAALTAVVDSAPDVIIADIGMAGEDGYTMMRRLRALPADAGGTIPAVALTAFVRPEDVERARAAGFQLHLAKPVDPAALAHAIARMLGREPPA